MTAERPPVSLPFRVASLPSRKATRFDLCPGPEASAALAAELDLLALTGLRFRGELRPAGRRDWVLEARLEAEVTQPCVVTLAPVVTQISEPVTRRYLADLPEPEAEEVEMPDETAETLPEVIDAGTVMAEALALALPAYPRAEGVAAGDAEARPEGAAPLSAEQTTRPFARLSELLKKPGGKA